ncbi:hypothetical protein B0O99DRAFT_643864 [Bisporella sp. PMI_857]|nr:hypothetical protein B0O99DRAFT_643864 [Bisporella sp. PMI_857]
MSHNYLPYFFLITLAALMQICFTQSPNNMAGEGKLSQPLSNAWMEAHHHMPDRVEERVRLRTGNSNGPIQPQLFGFPPLKPPARFSGHLKIADPYPAVLSYVLGAEWLSHLITTTAHNASDSWEVSHIPVPNDPTDEAAHCFKMRRCGATYQGQYRPWESQPPESLNDIKDYIMGWPSDGGVWVLRLPPGLFETRDLEEAMEYLGRIDDGTEVNYELEHRQLKEKLREQKDMDGYSKVLKHEGAMYFKDPKDCPEILRFGLL